MIDISFCPKFSIRKQAKILNISRSRFYYQAVVKDPIDLEIMRKIDEIYLQYPFYGSRRITAHLNHYHNYDINRKKIQRLMRSMGIEAVYCKKKTTIANKEHQIYPYLLRNLDIITPNQVWAGDISYIPMKSGFMYLMAIIDWYSRYIVGWTLSNTLDSYFCLEALDLALTNNQYEMKPKIFNTDQGCQFTSQSWINNLNDNDILISMDGKGRWIDNVIIERFFRNLKYEAIYLNPANNVKELIFQLKNYIEFYNNQRLHQGLDYKTPREVFLSK